MNCMGGMGNMCGMGGMNMGCMGNTGNGGMCCMGGMGGAGSMGAMGNAGNMGNMGNTGSMGNMGMVGVLVAKTYRPTSIQDDSRFENNGIIMCLIMHRNFTLRNLRYWYSLSQSLLKPRPKLCYVTYRSLVGHVGPASAEFPRSVLAVSCEPRAAPARGGGRDRGHRGRLTLVDTAAAQRGGIPRLQRAQEVSHSRACRVRKE